MALEPTLYEKQLLERILANEDLKDYVMRGILEQNIQTAVQTQPDLVGLADNLDVAIDKYKNFGKVTGISTGYAGLNFLTKGLRGGEVIVLSAKTSVGKTSLAMNVASNVAKNGHSVLFLTFEMTHDEIRTRYIHITGGLVDDQPTEDFYKVAGVTVLQKDEAMNWRDIAPLIEKAKKEIGAELVVIDHLHYFSREVKNANEEIGNITKEFKRASIANNVPIILIAHSRKTQKGEEIGSEDVRGSSYITQDADIVLLLNRDKDDPNIIKCTVTKNRNAGIDWNNNETHFKNDKTKLTEIEQW